MSSITFTLSVYFSYEDMRSGKWASYFVKTYKKLFSSVKRPSKIERVSPEFVELVLEEQNLIRFVGKENMTICYITEFPGNCAWLMAYSLPYTYIGEVMLMLDIIAKKLRYEGIIISLSSSQALTLQYCLDNGWTRLLKGKNRHSGNQVYLLYKRTQHEEDENG